MKEENYDKARQVAERLAKVIKDIENLRSLKKKFADFDLSGSDSILLEDIRKKEGSTGLISLIDTLDFSIHETFCVANEKLDCLLQAKKDEIPVLKEELANL